MWGMSSSKIRTRMTVQDQTRIVRVDKEEEQNPFQKDNVDVTNFLDLLNRIVTPPLPQGECHDPSDTLFG